MGTGRLSSHLKARCFNARGLDISPDMLALAKARAAVTGTRIELGIGDIRDIPFKDGSFDLVSCLRFLNWVDAEGVQQAVRELARVSGDKLLLGIRYFPPLSELKRYPFSMVRLGMRALGVAHVHAYRTGLRFQHKSFIDGLFERLGLEIVKERLVERRIDGTDYVFFLLRKAGVPGPISENSEVKVHRQD